MKREKNRVPIRRGYVRTIVCMLFSLCMLSGCTLARPELQQIEEEELCGILVVVGEQKAQSRHEEELEGRTFSSIRELEESLTSSFTVEGTLQTDRSIAFDGVEGHVLGVVEEEIEGAPSTCFINDGYFTKVDARVKVTDEGTENTISGSILAGENLKEPVYMYPVYHRSDGSYYTVLNSTGGMMCSVHDEGEVYSQTLQWETTEEINGRKEKNSREIKASLEMAIPVERVQVRMYNHENELLEAREISKETEELILQEGTAYVIVEEAKAGGKLRRSLYNREEAQEEMTHQINYLGNDGLIEPKELVMK